MIVGKYVVERKLGEGGYGEVLQVRDASGRRFALKRVIETARHCVQSLQAELKKLLRLRGAEGVIQVVDHGLDDRGAPYIVMELAEGSLLDLIDGPMPRADAANIGRWIVRVVRDAHARGVIHRDIKPDNLLRKAGAVKLADFGLGKGAKSILLTTGGAGTAGYMAPEQQLGRPQFASDVYSIGATLFHLVTGRRPPADRVALNPAQFGVRCDNRLSALIARMTAQAPERRPSLDEVDRALHAVGRASAAAVVPQVKVNNGQSDAGKVFGFLFTLLLLGNAFSASRRR